MECPCSCMRPGASSSNSRMRTFSDMSCPSSSMAMSTSGSSPSGRARRRTRTPKWCPGSSPCRKTWKGGSPRSWPSRARGWSRSCCDGRTRPGPATRLWRPRASARTPTAWSGSRRPLTSSSAPPWRQTPAHGCSTPAGNFARATAMRTRHTPPTGRLCRRPPIVQRSSMARAACPRSKRVARGSDWERTVLRRTTAPSPTTVVAGKSCGRACAASTWLTPGALGRRTGVAQGSLLEPPARRATTAPMDTSAVARWASGRTPPSCTKAGSRTRGASTAQRP
mmetsp:Transcript_126021/g.362448  ORF Transcript_126021/g.362448 Transcript_126021/m.362448 type:complete len:281 (-) Transcript_126021:116-958(-)